MFCKRKKGKDLVTSCIAISSHLKSWVVQDVSAQMPENSNKQGLYLGICRRPSPRPQKAESCSLQLSKSSASKCETYELSQAGAGERMFLDVSSPCPLSTLLGLQSLTMGKKINTNPANLGRAFPRVTHGQHLFRYNCPSPSPKIPLALRIPAKHLTCLPEQ